jgi:aminomethyltransferase
MVPYAGFEMPVQYEGVLAEHAAVRERVGLFDITHMGEILAVGDGAAAWLDGLCTNRVTDGEPGQVVYTAMCRDDGGVLDDMLIYRVDRAEWLVVCNAANHAKIAAWLRARAAGVADLRLEDVSDATAMIAVQGPLSARLIARPARLAPVVDRIAALDFYQHFTFDGPGGRWVVSRTGYTGEHGYELYVPNADAQALWEELLREGAELGVAPIGLAARDTLRFELGYCLYGHELSEDWSPLEGNIGWAVKLKGRDFVGARALAAQKAAGVPRRITGLEILPTAADGRPRPAAIARQDTPVFAGDLQVGVVTSGTKSPTTDRSLALALIDSAHREGDLEVEIRGKRHPVRVVAYPFIEARVKGDPQAVRS